MMLWSPSAAMRTNMPLRWPRWNKVVGPATNRPWLLLEEKAAVSNQAKKGDDLVWNDLVKTEKGGRARITLTDQSILSLGSQSQLKIVKHDDRSQQTALQLYGGRVRAEVAKITRQGGSFELRTPTAVQPDHHSEGVGGWANDSVGD